MPAPARPVWVRRNGKVCGRGPAPQRPGPRQAEAIQLSYFGGLTFDEIALALEVSPATAQRDLKAARMWLLKELQRRGWGA